MLGGLEAEPVTELVDRLLELRIVEGDQHATAVADHVVMVLLMVEMGALVARHPITDVNAGDQVQAVKQIERAVNTGAPDGTITERLLHVRNAHRAVTLSHDLNQRVPRGALAMARAADQLVCRVFPGIFSPLHGLQFIGARR